MASLQPVIKGILLFLLKIAVIFSNNTIFHLAILLGSLLLWRRSTGLAAAGVVFAAIAHIALKLKEDDVARHAKYEHIKLIYAEANTWLINQLSPLHKEKAKEKAYRTCVRDITEYV
ncbi:hypothetical protein EDD85DRAFT_792171 [Armillaria nabsnona]|nr:hypothetical protein EDD85DRAFT_792171 [Armillaria nabsnona]